MKKTYIAPVVEVINVSAVNMLASSLVISETSVDTSAAGVQLGREENASRPSIWEQGW